MMRNEHRMTIIPWTAATRAILILIVSIAVPMSPGCSVSPRPAGSSAAPATLTVVTLNIRHDNPGDGPDAWPRRADELVAALDGFDADVIGLQEVLPGQADRIADDLPGFEMLVRSRERTAGRGEAVPILWRTSAWRLDPDAHGTFWLSETPDVPGSKSWDSSLPRIVTWARLLPASTHPYQDERRPFWIFNAHFDHRGKAARFESASLLVERILDWCDPDEPVVLMGDLNARPGEPPILHLDRGTSTAPGLIDCWASLNPTTVEGATWNGFEVVETGPRIDYVFARGLAVRSADIERPLTAEGRPISDHWPVRVVLEAVAASGP